MELTVAALNRKAWGLFLLAAVLAAGWFRLNLIAPDLVVGPVPLRLVFMLLSNAVLLYGLWRALARAGFPQTMRVTAWIGVALLLVIWIGTIWTLAANEVFQRSIGNFPTLPIAIIVPVVLGLFVLTRSQAVASVLDATPPSWLVGLQVYRILGIVFLVSWIRGAIPGAFALPAGIGDVAVGLFALPAAVWVATGFPAGRRIAIRWNLFGLTSPGPAHLLARDHPNTVIATFPMAMVPAFIVPFSTLLHVLFPTAT